jgi:hypothetical protein
MLAKFGMIRIMSLVLWHDVEHNTATLSNTDDRPAIDFINLYLFRSSHQVSSR